MGHHAIIHHRLAALRLNNLPAVILGWIYRDLEGVDAASVEAILTPDYAVLATRLAIAEMVSFGVPVGLGARAPEGR